MLRTGGKSYKPAYNRWATRRAADLKERRELQDELNRMVKFYKIVEGRPISFGKESCRGSLGGAIRAYGKTITSAGISPYSFQRRTLNWPSFVSPIEEQVPIHREDLTPPRDFGLLNTYKTFLETRRIPEVTGVTLNINVRHLFGDVFDVTRELGIKQETVDLIVETSLFMTMYPIAGLFSLYALSQRWSIEWLKQQFIAFQYRSGSELPGPLVLNIASMIDRFGHKPSCDILYGYISNGKYSADEAFNLVRVFTSLAEVINSVTKFAWRSLNAVTLGVPATLNYLVMKAPTLEFLWTGVYHQSEGQVSTIRTFNLPQLLANDICFNVAQMLLVGKFTIFNRWLRQPILLEEDPSVTSNIQLERVSVGTQTDIEMGRNPLEPHYLLRTGEYQLQIEHVDVDIDPRLAAYNASIEAGEIIDDDTLGQMSDVSADLAVLLESEMTQEVRDLITADWDRRGDPKFVDWVRDLLAGDCECEFELWLEF
jgi:hypothetical protein